MKTLRLLATASLAFTSLSVGLADDESATIIDERFDARSIALVDAQTFRGNITVTGEDRADILVRATQLVRHANESEAAAVRESIRSEIRVDSETVIAHFDRDPSSGWSFWDLFRSKPEVLVHLEIAVPQRIAQTLRTSGGNISVTNVKAPVEAKTSGGRLDFDRIYGDVDARTSGGHIKATDINGRLLLSTSGGHITVDSVQGHAEVKTSGGHITLNGLRGSVTARTSGGHVSATFPEGVQEYAELRTSGGNVTAKLPAGQSFRFEAQTSGGRIRTDFPVTTTGVLASNKAEGDVNGGGPLLTLRTSGGNIALQSL